MKSEQWRKIDQVLTEALEREPANRSSFLDEACAGDEQLRCEVESLLAHEVGQSFNALAVQEAGKLLARKSEDLTGVSVGHFRLVRLLGMGGMGRVYLAQDERLNRPIAVKFLNHIQEEGFAEMRRFRREALAASALNHPNILTIHEIGELDGENFIATEFVDGVTLRERMKAGPVPLGFALDLSIQVASALSAAHSSKIVHRDIKPDNLMIRPDGLVKVLDFGVAKNTQVQVGDEEIDTLLMTTPGMVVGTVAYMSPEQARGKPVDARSDIWSLGVVIYEMVTRRRPFEGDTMLDLMSAIINRHPLPIDDSVPEELQRIVLKTLEKDRDKRYQTANEMLTDLKKLGERLKEAPGAASSSSEQESLSAGLTPKSRQPEAKDLMTNNAGTMEEGDRQTIEEAEANQAFARTTSSIREPGLRGYLKVLSLIGVVLAVAAVAAYWFYGFRQGPIQSIAVLPFRNESGNIDLEYLSDGMTESLINSLSQIPSLSIKARSTVFRYKGLEVEPQRIGSDLSVQAVLNGRVVQRGDQLTLYLSLVDAKNGNQIWGAQYDRHLTDLILLQREIAHDVSQKLRLRLSGADEGKLTKDYTANAAAYQLYLQGRFHVFKLIPSEIQQGISKFQEAIQLDPNYALAYVGLSEANRSLALGSELPANEYLSNAKAAALKSLEIDDGLSEAHSAYATSVFWYDRNWSEAESHFVRAIELNPNSPDAHLFLAHLFSITARHDQALREIDRAVELDPYSPFVNSLRGQFLLAAGKTDEALARLHETIALAPEFWFPHLFVSAAYLEKKMFPEAISEANIAWQLSGRQTLALSYKGCALAKLGKNDEARQLLDTLLAMSKERYVSPYSIAILEAGLGDNNEALVWLEKALVMRDPKVAFLKIDRKFNNLRSDSRFQDLIRRAGF